MSLQDKFLFLCDTIKAATCSSLLSDCKAISLEQASAQICDVYTHAGLDDLVKNFEIAGQLSEALLLVRSELPPCSDGMERLYGILQSTKVGLDKSGDNNGDNTDEIQWVLMKVSCERSDDEERSDD